MKAKLLKAGVLAQTLLVLLVNYFAAMGQINNTSPAEISDKYPTMLTPAGFAFSIWSLIYFGMIAFSIYQYLPRQDKNRLLEQTRIPYILLCTANIGWIFAWHYNLIPVSLVLMALILTCLLVINRKTKNADEKTDKLLVRLPFSIYFGWITVASVLNLLITVAYLGFAPAGTAASAIGVLLIAMVVAIGVLVRFKFDSMAYPLTIAWGITAIGVEQSGNTVVVLATAIGMMTLIFFSLWGYVKDR
ncbi:MAG: tryptophan-rich sensory protein [Acidobacteriota bacterium]|nr:tryptophan-rich sensory protein [Acidobacteriota bacterium]MDH3528834.1 tryptophan-rich sensory protein [Acidobacteriota bacterium]